MRPFWQECVLSAVRGAGIGLGVGSAAFFWVLLSRALGYGW